MARIRTVKPEFWTSEQVVDCSTNARLLFIGLWNFADDGGVHPFSVRRLKMQIFPGDPFSDDEVAALVEELLRVKLLRSFTVNVERFLVVTGWRHQKIEKPTYRWPQPNDATKFDDGSANDQQPVDADSTSDQRTVDEPSPPEGSGRESKGKEEDPSRPGESGQVEQQQTQTSAKHPSVADFEIAELMAGCIADASPGHRELRDDKRAATIARWADTIRLMRERDGRDPALIRRVFSWANRDGFWRAQILSAQSLRDKFDQLNAKMLCAGNGRQTSEAVARSSANMEAASRVLEGLSRGQ